MADPTDKITDTRNAARPNSARANGTRAAGGTSLSCDDLTGWPVASKVHFVTYQIDSNSNPVAGTQLDCRGIISGNTVGSFAVLDGNDTGNSIGDVVEMLPTSSWGQDLADALTHQHSRIGAHVGITNTSGMTTDTLTVTSGTTLPTGDIGTADIADAAITNAKLSTTAGELGGAWLAWTPTWDNLTVGNAVQSFRYTKVGKTIRFRGYITLGSTSAVGSGPDFSLPVAALDANKGTASGSAQIGWVYVEDNATGNYQGPLTISGTTLAVLGVYNTSGTYAGDTNLTSTIPITFGNGDEIRVFGVYEAA